MTVPGSLLPEKFPALFPFDVPMTELSISSNLIPRPVAKVRKYTGANHGTKTLIYILQMRF